MLQARIGRLNLETRRMLHAASVFGQYFWTGGLALLLGCERSAPELQSWLQELIDAELIQRHPSSRIANEPEYGFRHVLMRDAAYALITDEARVSAHCVAANYLHNHPEARIHLCSALAALDALPEDNANRRKRIEITLQLMDVSRSTDAPEEYIARLQKAEESARHIPESEQFSEHYKQLALLNYWLGYTHYLANQTPQAIKYFNYVLSQKNIDEKTLALPLVAIGRLSLFTGNFVKAASMLERAVNAAGTVVFE